MWIIRELSGVGEISFNIGIAMIVMSSAMVAGERYIRKGGVEGTAKSGFGRHHRTRKPIRSALQKMAGCL